jgi:hypothetical protein
MAIFSKLYPDVLESILECMSIPSLVMLSATSRYHFGLVHHHIRSRLIRLITPFFDEPEIFLSLLRFTGSVISGSQALIFMMPAYQGCWGPRDMDIYTGKEGYRTVVEFLRDEWGYEMELSECGVVRTVDDEEEEEGSRKYDSIGGISHVIGMRKGGRRVDIILSDRQASIYPIFFFHSTLVQNFISGTGFFSAYPTLTDMGRGIINPIGFWPGGEPTKNTKAALAKYSHRGFDIQASHAGWQDNSKPKHKCHQSTICPHTMRNTTDGGCLFVPFLTGGERGTLCRLFAEGRVIIWNLGGDGCDGNYKTLKPSVICSHIVA